MRKLVSVFSSAFMLVVFVHNVYAQNVVYTPSMVPNPKNENANGWISDPDGYLSDPEIKNINEVCDDLKSKVDVELAVVMLKNINEYRYDAFDFCQELFNSWGIGGAEKNTGVLVFFCEGSRDIRIHTGGGMEGLLPDAVCNEIIDNSIGEFSDGQYAMGVMNMVFLIYKRLMTDEAQAELVLGWAPKHYNSEDNTIYWYFVVGILLLVLLAYLSYRIVPIDDKKGVELEKREKAYKDLDSIQVGAGCLSFIFPLPLLFIYLYMRVARKHLRTAPAYCKNCGHKMNLVKENPQNYLSLEKQTEVRLMVNEYDVWSCPECGKVETVAYNGKFYDRYKECNKCGAKASKYVNSKIIESATTKTPGKGLSNYKCEHCGNEFSETFIIPIIKPKSRTSYSSGGSYSSGRSSGGSWGGGRSYGGGAGRKF